MDISTDKQIKNMIREGSVFYFSEESFNTESPHYFVVLNYVPINNEELFLICAVTFDTKVYERIEKQELPQETYVDVIPEQCKVLKKISLFDCNQVFVKSVDVIVDKISDRKLKICGYIEDKILERLRNGVLKSPLVEKYIKNILQK